jgi:hypothetical protein
MNQLSLDTATMPMNLRTVTGSDGLSGPAYAELERLGAQVAAGWVPPCLRADAPKKVQCESTAGISPFFDNPDEETAYPLLKPIADRDIAVVHLLAIFVSHSFGHNLIKS